MSKLEELRAFWRAYRHQDEVELGDMAILKAQAFGVKVPPGVDARLEPVRGYLPQLSLAALRELPPESLGRAVARQLDDNGFKLFSVSEAMRARVEEQTYILRYLATHDFIHVLTGFDTSLSGELGVLALTVEQGFAPAGVWQERIARVVYPLRSPSAWRELERCRVLGHQLGAQAEFMLAVRFEDHLEEPLSQVRRMVGLPTLEA